MTYSLDLLLAVRRRLEPRSPEEDCLLWGHTVSEEIPTVLEDLLMTSNEREDDGA